MRGETNLQLSREAESRSLSRRVQIYRDKVVLRRDAATLLEFIFVKCRARYGTDLISRIFDLSNVGLDILPTRIIGFFYRFRQTKCPTN